MIVVASLRIVVACSYDDLHTRFKYRENHRDDWSVYLKDSLRGVNIQLDLHTKKVMYSDPKSPRRVQYVIKNAR